MSEVELQVEHPAPGVVLLRFNRPASANALNDSMIGKLYDALDAVREDAGARVVILTGAGSTFCAGMDMRSEDRKKRRSNVVTLFGGQERFAGMTRRMRALKQPVIAAVNGAAAGAGMGLALAADLRIAVPEARFMVAAIRIGLSAGECGISYHLPRIIGSGRAFEAMLTGRAILGDEAERIGLVTSLAARADLETEAIALAQQIAANSPFGVAQTKKVMWANLEASGFDAALELENRTQVMMAQTLDFDEATQAFLEKRPPVFIGR